jgi:hypothetical protein
MKKRDKKYTYYIIGGIVVVLILLGLGMAFGGITGFVLFGNDGEKLETKFNEVVLEAMYSREYCNDGRNQSRELRNGEDCIETLYPYVKIKHSEEYIGLDQLVLATRIENAIKKQMPETANQDIRFVFVDSNQMLVNTIGMKNSEVTKYPDIPLL